MDLYALFGFLSEQPIKTVLWVLRRRTPEEDFWTEPPVENANRLGGSLNELGHGPEEVCDLICELRVYFLIGPSYHGRRRALKGTVGAKLDSRGLLFTTERHTT